MYTPASFAGRDESRLFDLLDAHPFATLVVPGEPPEITHLPLVVAFTIPITGVEGKLKLSQNRLPEDRASVMAALAARGTDGDREMLALMKP
jgi:predicted FMN-binding regulatory protein PaiB